MSALITKIAVPDVERLMGQRFEPREVARSINAFLFDDGQQRTLIDTGAGDLFEGHKPVVLGNVIQVAELLV